ncbi:hypothetical protein ACM46_10130 [Chryseobacterium angstadtii]|uniref:Lysylphosphatidylglycerol synthetase n=1 Tax=Chryseobacterium angstadtii TaxID=558151 RepID=A0A0J7IGT5_9FLAO|nr:hypothetical protein ACM46_10130 [Chryseobacterium angstadtii]
MNGLKVLISIVFLYFVFRKIPFYDIAKIWSGVKLFYLFPGSLFFLASQVLSAKRLELYLKVNDFNLSFKSNLQLYFLGMFYNFFIPGGIGGDAYKIYILNKKLNWNVKKLTLSIFNDRLSGLLAICILILFFSIFLLPVQWIFIPIVLIVAGTFVAFLIIKKVFSLDRSVFFRTLFISMIIQILQVICFVLLLKSLDLNENFTVYIITFLGSSILSLISFAGIGAREFLFLQASKYFDFNTSVSVSASLLFTMITAFFSLFGLVSMFRKYSFEDKIAH